LERSLVKTALAAALALAPVGGEVVSRWAFVATYSSLLYVVDPPSLILASWGVGASLSLAVLTASVAALAALVFGDGVAASMRSAAGLVVVAGAVPAMFAGFAVFFGLPIEEIWGAYAVASVAHLSILALAVPLAATTAVLGGVRGLTDVVVAFIAGVLSLFVSSLLGVFLVRAASGDYVVSTSIAGISRPSIGVVGAQIMVYELFLLFMVGAAFRR